MGYYDEMMELEAARRRASRGLSRRERIEDELEQEWYTVPEAAPVIRLSTKRIYDLIREGKLEHSKPSPRKTLIHRTDLAKYLSKKSGKKSE